MRTGYQQRTTAGDKTICLPLPEGIEYAESAIPNSTILSPQISG
jgi:hypothetical protein